MPMNDMLEIGAFAAGSDDQGGKQLYLQKHRIRSGNQQVTFIVPHKPAEAGIDPNCLLIDTNPYDNLKKVKIKKPVKLFGAVQVKQ